MIHGFLEIGHRNLSNQWLVGFTSTKGFNILVFYSKHSYKMHKLWRLGHETKKETKIQYVVRLKDFSWLIVYPTIDWWAMVGYWYGLGRGVDLRMAQLMSLSLTDSRFSKIHIGFYLSGTGSLG